MRNDIILIARGVINVSQPETIYEEVWFSNKDAADTFSSLAGVDNPLPIYGPFVNASVNNGFPFYQVLTTI
jgi:hypothetical protein